MIIKNLKIIGLYGIKNYNIDFNEKLTLLYGYNGSGKTTVLNILSYLITGNVAKLSKYKFKKVVLEYCDENNNLQNLIVERKANNIDFLYKSEKISINRIYLGNLENEYDDISYRLRDKNKILLSIKKDFNSLYLSLNRITRLSSDYLIDHSYSISSRSEYIRRNTVNLEGFNMMNEVKSLVKEQYIEISKKLYEYNEEFKTDLLKSLVSFSVKEKSTILNQIGANDLTQLREKTEKYFDILLKNKLIKSRQSFNTFFNKLISAADKNDIGFLFTLYDLSKMDIVINCSNELDIKTEKIMEPVTLFCETINDYLSLNKSSKRIDIINGNLVMKDNVGNEIDLEYLSSGEKQIITFYANLLFGVDSNKPSIIIVDEPELSLHLSWQEIYINKTLKVSRNVQFIFATHSPEIVGNYSNYMVNIQSED